MPGKHPTSLISAATGTIRGRCIPHAEGRQSDQAYLPATCPPSPDGRLVHLGMPNQLPANNGNSWTHGASTGRRRPSRRFHRRGLRPATDYGDSTRPDGGFRQQPTNPLSLRADLLQIHRRPAKAAIACRQTPSHTLGSHTASRRSHGKRSGRGRPKLIRKRPYRNQAYSFRTWCSAPGRSA